MGMKKIGILTLHRANNYGAVLQNYALQQALLNLGAECETIDYIIPQIEKEYKNITLYRGLNPLKSICGLFWDIVNYSNSSCAYKKFEEFRNSKLQISSRRFDKTTINQCMYDVIIVGSDQVWNSGIVRYDNIPTFGLDFTKSIKATYAASCGNIKSIIPIELIRKFDYITVREKDLCDYLNDKGISAELVCDPTILLTKEVWQELIVDTKIDHSNYVYLYYIDSGKDEAAQIANDIASKEGINVYYSKRIDIDAIKHNYGVNRFSDGPLEFIKEIEQAEYVVVSSFHGVVFSILFEKEFVTLLHDNTGSRVFSLLKQLGLEDRIVKDYADYKCRKFDKIDFSSVRLKLDVMRKKSLEELRRISML